MQVAASTIIELGSMDLEDTNLNVLMSTEVTDNVSAARQGTPLPFPHETLDMRGIDLTNKAARRLLDKYDAVFTLFGPLYRWHAPFRSIVGFAQSWIIYPNNECYAQLPVVQRFLMRLKYRIQSVLFKRADALVVELEHVKIGLIRELGIAPERIHVISNCLSSIYRDESIWEPVTMSPVDCDLRLGFVGRNYLHKNTAIFPKVAKILAETYNIVARFYVTFTDAEWKACTPEFRAVCINVGPISTTQCPAFYRALDGVIFPSLLECFSATPLEAMAMEKPLFASDRAFNRDVCKQHAHYFDPMAPDEAAEQIARVFDGSVPDPAALRRARDHAIAFASPKERAEKYLALLKSEMKPKKENVF